MIYITTKIGIINSAKAIFRPGGGAKAIFRPHHHSRRPRYPVETTTTRASELALTLATRSHNPQGRRMSVRLPARTPTYDASTVTDYSGWDFTDRVEFCLKLRNAAN
eukprot:198715-Rhodomonas_salina.2